VFSLFVVNCASAQSKSRSHMHVWKAGQSLRPGQRIYSTNNKYALAFGDYGLWIYDAMQEEGAPVWITQSVDSSASCKFDSGGDIYIKDKAEKILWHSGTARKNAKYITLSNSGIANMYDSIHSLIWSTRNILSQKTAAIK
jgi:hypothetical protein